MISIEIETPSRHYPVYISAGLLRQGAVWRKHIARRPLLIVSNETVAPLYLDALKAGIGDPNVNTLVLPDGEQFKDLAHWQIILQRLVDMKATRDSVIIALGGGVIGDMAGYAAASYMRGISFIQAPTTLLAQVDASVGGKTGINHAAGKNLIGAFHQPDAVVIDTDTLNTLAEREYKAGLAEVVKYGAIRSEPFLQWLESNHAALTARIPETVSQAIEQSVRHKAAVVSADEGEKGVRAILNFGHTFAHGIETLTGYRDWLHGEAVSIGMILAVRLGSALGITPASDGQRLTALLQQLGLPTALPESITGEALIDCMRLDKKHQAGGFRFILLQTLGQALIDESVQTADLETLLTPNPGSGMQ